MENNNLYHRLEKIKLVALDVDGTLTDGTIQIINNHFIRRYSILDGVGIKKLIENNIVVAIITASSASEGSDAIIRRMRSLNICHVYTAVKNKLDVLHQIMDAENVDYDDIAYVGDDLPDMAPMKKVGLACAPQSAIDDVLAISHYITKRPAGNGAVREIADMILMARINQ